jgi:hypothetical protein
LRGGGGTLLGADAGPDAAPDEAVLACREAPAPARNGEPRRRAPRRERRNALAAVEKDMAEGDQAREPTATATAAAAARWGGRWGRREEQAEDAEEGLT